MSKFDTARARGASSEAVFLILARSSLEQITCRVKEPGSGVGFAAAREQRLDSAPALLHPGRAAKKRGGAG